MNPKSITSGSPTSPVTQAGTAQALKGDKAKTKKAEQNRNDPNRSVDVAISEESLAASRDRAKALRIARETPDIRADRVAELRQRIQSGQYKVDSGKVADGMVREAIRDYLAEQPDS